MFDRSILETDNFLNISLTAKALYFLLGMEADDEGFVSPKRILRLYGGEMGDLKNLIDTGLVIPFKSGVIVITDWNQNNWLDNRRIRPTQYQTEKKMLILTEQKKYELSSGSAGAQLVESSIEQRSIEEREHSLTPSEEAKLLFSRDSLFVDGIVAWLGSCGAPEQLAKRELDVFIAYWTEKNKSGTRERWELQKTFEVKRRLATWFSRIKEFDAKGRGGKVGIAL
jgi:hypothetical protein